MTKEFVSFKAPESHHKIPIDTIEGPTGKSAFQSAVDYGFVGSEEEWVASLHAVGIVDPQTGEPVPEVVQVLSDAILDPYEVDSLTAYNLGKI